jgi:HlyD family secretion protein
VLQQLTAPSAPLPTAPVPAAPLAAAPMPAGPHRRGRRWLIGAAVLIVLLAVAGGAWWATQGEARISYTTAPVTRGAVTRAVTATGTVNPVLTIIVGSYVSGVIRQLFCDYNTEVKQGQVCAKIDPRPYQSVVDQDKANLDIAKAQLEKDKASLVYAQVNYERNRLLALRNFVSRDVADNARSVYEQAQAQIALDAATIELRQALLDAANINLGYTDIASPVNGTVVSRNVTMGQTVAATFQTPTLFLIASDLTKMEVDTNVSESDIGAIKQGNKASFTVDAYPGRIFAGTVVQVRQSPQTVQNVVTYDVVVGADNADLALKPGMTASTQIIIDQRSDVIRVPDQALRYAPGVVAAPTAAPGASAQARLWLLRDGHAVAVPVVLGLDDDSFTELVSGEVKPGDAVIVAEQRGSSTRTALPLPRL